MCLFNVPALNMPRYQLLPPGAEEDDIHLFRRHREPQYPRRFRFTERRQTLGDRMRMYFRPSSPPRRGEPTAEGCPDLPIIRPGRAFAGEVALMLNACAERLNPSQTMDRPFLDRYLVRIVTPEDYSQWHEDIIRDVEAIGIMSLDLEKRTWHEEDLIDAHIRRGAFLPRTKLRPKPDREGTPPPPSDFPKPQVEEEGMEFDVPPSPTPEERAAFWKTPERPKRPQPEEEPDDDELQLDVGPEDDFDEEEKREFSEADLIEATHLPSYVLLGTYRRCYLFDVPALAKNVDDETRVLPEAFRNYFNANVGARFVVVGSALQAQDVTGLMDLGLHKLDMKDCKDIQSIRLPTETEEQRLRPGMAKAQLVCYGSHAKLLRSVEMIRAYERSMEQWRRRRYLEKIDEYRYAWWRTAALYLWVTDKEGELRTFAKNYMFFDSQAPVLYCLRYVLQTYDPRAIQSPLDVVNALKKPTWYPREQAEGQLSFSDPDAVVPLPIVDVAPDVTPLHSKMELHDLRLIHPNVNVRFQFAAAFDKTPSIVGICKRCGLSSEHEAPDCNVENFIRCVWPLCRKEEPHAFNVCPVFVRRCTVTKCQLRGHYAADHDKAREIFGTPQEYVHFWDAWADQHFYTRIRRIYAPWGCYRFIQELDHISISEAYYFSPAEWRYFVNSMRGAKALLTFNRAQGFPESSEKEVPVPSDNVFQLQHRREMERLNVRRRELRREIEYRVLGRPMSAAERQILLLQTRTRAAVESPEALEYMARFIRFREDNKRKSLYFLLLDEDRLAKEIEKVPAKIYPNLDEFDYTMEPTVRTRRKDGTYVNTCRLCERELKFPPGRYGHCVCCGLPNKPRTNEELRRHRLDAARRIYAAQMLSTQTELTFRRSTPKPLDPRSSGTPTSRLRRRPTWSHRPKPRFSEAVTGLEPAPRLTYMWIRIQMRTFTLLRRLCAKARRGSQTYACSFSPRLRRVAVIRLILGHRRLVQGLPVQAARLLWRNVALPSEKPVPGLRDRNMDVTGRAALGIATVIAHRRRLVESRRAVVTEIVPEDVIEASISVCKTFLSAPQCRDDCLLPPKIYCVICDPCTETKCGFYRNCEHADSVVWPT
jgi:hypothetical protein